MSGLMFMNLIFRNSYKVNYNLPYNYGYAVFRKMPEVSELCRLAFAVIIFFGIQQVFIRTINVADDENATPLLGSSLIIYD